MCHWFDSGSRHFFNCWVITFYGGDFFYLRYNVSIDKTSVANVCMIKQGLLWHRNVKLVLFLGIYRLYYVFTKQDPHTTLYKNWAEERWYE